MQEPFLTEEEREIAGDYCTDPARGLHVDVLIPHRPPPPELRSRAPQELIHPQVMDALTGGTRRHPGQGVPLSVHLMEGRPDPRDNSRVETIARVRNQLRAIPPTLRLFPLRTPDDPSAPPPALGPLLPKELDPERFGALDEETAYVAWVDDDVVLPPYALATAIAALHNPRGGCYAGFGIYYPWTQREQVVLIREGPHSPHLRLPPARGHIAMGAVVIRRRVHDLLNPFKHSISGLPGSDTDACECYYFSRDIRALGYRYEYMPGLRASHLRWEDEPQVQEAYRVARGRPSDYRDTSELLPPSPPPSPIPFYMQPERMSISYSTAAADRELERFRDDPAQTTSLADMQKAYAAAKAYAAPLLPDVDGVAFLAVIKELNRQIVEHITLPQTPSRDPLREMLEAFALAGMSTAAARWWRDGGSNDEPIPRSRALVPLPEGSGAETAP